MAKWYEAANEASFKPVAGGYVFQSPNPWIFARPRYYLLNEAQKAEISERLRRWRLLIMTFTPISFLILASVVAFAILSPATFVPVFRQLGEGAFALLLIVVMTLMLTPLVLAPHIYLIRALRPLLANAPRTSERITMNEQLPKIAASVSGKVLVAGLAGGVGMICGSVLVLLDAFFEGHLARSLLFFSPVLAVGGVLIVYFFYLARLKARLKRAAS